MLTVVTADDVRHRPSTTGPFIFHAALLPLLPEEGQRDYRPLFKVILEILRDEGVSKLIHPLFYSSFTLSTI